MNIFKLEFKQKRKSMLIWTACIVLWALLVVAFIPTLVDLGEGFSEVLSQMGAIGEAFNIGVDTFSTIIGIVGMYFGILLICFAIQAANYGFGLVTIEESELTADFLITKPVKRGKIMTSKILAALSALLFTNVVYVISTFLFILAIAGERELDKKTLLLILCSAFFVQLFFFSFGLLVSLLLKKVKSVTPFSMGAVFGLYILSTFGRSLKIEFLEYINPFSYFDNAIIAAEGKYNMVFFVINIAFVIVAITASYILYKRRDIKSL